MGRTLRSLYICYLSLEDPLVHSQVVAYLEGLSRSGHTIHLLTFDAHLSEARRTELRDDLAARGITWHSRGYHKRPSLPATVYDTLAGAISAIRIVRQYGLDAIHARNHVPAAMGLLARGITGRRLIFDLRGLMAEEYVDAGHWREGGIPYRLTHAVQRAAIRKCDGMVMLTDAVRRYLFGDSEKSELRVVIPCCADLSRLDGSAPGARIRSELELGDRPVMVYVGKFTGWYMEREMVDFFVAARPLRPGLAFLVLTQSDPSIIEREFQRAGVSSEDYRVTSAQPSDVPAYLAVAEFGISFVRPCFSKISSSPTKIGEYLAAGLPVVSTSGIGDTDALLDGGRVGAVVSRFDSAAYEAAAAEAMALAKDADARERCVAVARERLSLDEVGIPRYDRLYRAVAGTA